MVALACETGVNKVKPEQSYLHRADCIEDNMTVWWTCCDAHTIKQEAQQKACKQMDENVFKEAVPSRFSTVVDRACELHKHNDFIDLINQPEHEEKRR